MVKRNTLLYSVKIYDVEVQLKRRNVNCVIGRDKTHSTARVLLFRHWREPLLYTRTVMEVAPCKKFIALQLPDVVIREYGKSTLLKEKGIQGSLLWSL